MSPAPCTSWNPGNGGRTRSVRAGFLTRNFAARMCFAPGGLGLAPLRSLINQVVDERSSFGRVIILYGARNPSEMLFKEELEEWAGRKDLEFHVNCGSRDEKLEGQRRRDHNFVPQISINSRNTVAITCGRADHVPLRVDGIAGQRHLERNIFLSLERHMKCGVGKCGHCQINHVYACQSGPFSLFRDHGMEEAL